MKWSQLLQGRGLEQNGAAHGRGGLASVGAGKRGKETEESRRPEKAETE